MEAKKFFPRLWLSGLACLLALFFLPYAVAAEPGQGRKPHYVLEIGTVVPGQMGWAQRAKETIIPFADRISNGDLDIRVYWGGIRGDDEDIFDQVKSGRLQGGAFSGYGASLVCPEFSVLSLPFLFNDYGEVDYIRDRMMPAFENLFERHGFALFLWVDQDFDQLYSMKESMTRLEHYRESRFIQWYGAVEKELFRAWATPYVSVRVPQVTDAVSSGRADAALGPAIWALGSQLYPKVRYVNRLKVRYSPVAVALAERFWDRVPAAYRERARTERGPLMDQFNEYSREDAERCIDAMLAYGIRESQVDPEDLPQLKAIARTSWQRLSGRMFPGELLDTVLANLEEYRARNAKEGGAKQPAR